MNALIRNRNARLSFARLAASIDKDSLTQSLLLPCQRDHQLPTERYVNTYSRRFFSDSTEVCATHSTTIFPFHFFYVQFLFLFLCDFKTN